MNNDPANAEQQRIIAQAAAEYVPPIANSHTLLMPFRDSIRTLRGKGASYRSIASILGAVKVEVSLDTLSRFCHEFVEDKPARKSTRRRRRSSFPELPATPPPPAPRPSTPAADTAKSAEPRSSI